MDKMQTVQEALDELLAENKSLLNNSKELVAALTARVMPGLQLAFFRKALLDANIGEILLVADDKGEEARAIAASRAAKKLKAIHIQETRIVSIVQTLTAAMGWQTLSINILDSSSRMNSEPEQPSSEDIKTEQTTVEIKPEELLEFGVQEELFEQNPEHPTENFTAESTNDDFPMKIAVNGEPVLAPIARKQQELRERQERVRQETEQKEQERESQERERQEQEKERIEKLRLANENPLINPGMMTEREKSELEISRQEKNQQQEDNNFPREWFLIVLAFVAVIGGVIAMNSSDSSKPPSSSITNTKALTTTSSPTTKESTREASETSLAGIEIGMTVKEMISANGSAKSYGEFGFPGYTEYDYGNVFAVVKGERVCAIYSNEPTAGTKRGVHAGTSEQELKKFYGDTSIIYLNQRLYEFTSKDKQKCYVGFAVDNGAVLQILIAEIDVFDFISAGHSLLNFHALITERNYSDAYDYYLTENMKNQLGNYDSWKSGYRTTVSSEIKKINSIRKKGDAVEIAYDLEAVDDPGGTHYFTGKAIIKKNGGLWAIDSMENR